MKSPEQVVDVYKTIISKRDTRSYSERPISDESLHRILQAGRMAGSAKNAQPCRFVVVRSAEKKRELAGCGQFAQQVPNAAVAIAVVIPNEGREFDAGRAAQNMMLAAWAEGITSCAVTMHDVDCARRALGLPEGYRVAIVVPFGHPPEEGIKPGGAKRLPLEEIVHNETW
jgi:nitroreductase